jgi:hypothetical protein
MDESPSRSSSSFASVFPRIPWLHLAHFGVLVIGMLVSVNYRQSLSPGNQLLLLITMCVAASIILTYANSTSMLHLLWLTAQPRRPIATVFDTRLAHRSTTMS